MVYHDQVRFIPQIQDWSNICKSTDLTHHVSGIKGKIPHNLNKYKKKKFDKTKHSFMMKTLNKPEIKGNLNLTKGVYEKS